MFVTAAPIRIREAETCFMTCAGVGRLRRRWNVDVLIRVVPVSYTIGNRCVCSNTHISGKNIVLKNCGMQALSKDMSLSGEAT